MEPLNEIFTWATGLINSLTALVTDSPITYLLIFAMAAIDVIVPVIPAEATVTASAVLAGQGTLNIVWVMVAAGLGAFVGDNVAYWIGRAAGRPLVEKVLRGNTRQLDAVQEQFDRRGGMFVIVGRFVPGGRTAVAIGAGVLHFRWLRFVFYDAIAAVIWSFQAALPGFIGGSLVQDQPWLAMVFGFVLSALLAVGIALFQRRRDKVRARELPLKPAVIGVGGVDAAIESHDQAVAEVLAEESAGTTIASASVVPDPTADTGADPDEPDRVA